MIRDLLKEYLRILVSLFFGKKALYRLKIRSFLTSFSGMRIWGWEFTEPLITAWKGLKFYNKGKLIDRLPLGVTAVLPNRIFANKFILYWLFSQRVKNNLIQWSINFFVTSRLAPTHLAYDNSRFCFWNVQNRFMSIICKFSDTLKPGSLLFYRDSWNATTPNFFK